MQIHKVEENDIIKGKIIKISQFYKEIRSLKQFLWAIFGIMIENLCSLYVGREKILKINKRDVPNKGVMVGKSSEEQMNVQHVY